MMFYPVIPQDLRTVASPTFAGLTVTGDALIEGFVFGGTADGTTACGWDYTAGSSRAFALQNSTAARLVVESTTSLATFSLISCSSDANKRHGGFFITADEKFHAVNLADDGLSFSDVFTWDLGVGSGNVVFSYNVQASAVTASTTITAYNSTPEAITLDENCISSSFLKFINTSSDVFTFDTSAGDEDVRFNFTGLSGTGSFVYESDTGAFFFDDPLESLDVFIANSDATVLGDLDIGTSAVSAGGRNSILFNPDGYSAPNGVNSLANGDKLVLWNTVTPSIKTSIGVDVFQLWLQSSGSASSKVSFFTKETTAAPTERVRIDAYGTVFLYGGVSHKAQTVTGAGGSPDLTLDGTQYTVLLDGGSNTATVNFDAAPKTGQVYNLKCIDDTNTCTVNPNGKTIDGGSSIVLIQDESITVHYDGTEWWII